MGKYFMGEQSAARIGGDDYQHLYGWYAMLQLLDDSGDFDHVYIEHPKAGSADDITMHPKPGRKIAARYYQVKWHRTTAGQYDFDYFLQVKKPSVTSLLQKLFESWKQLKDDSSAEIWLVSNWPAATDFGECIRESYELDESFHSKGPHSKLGKARKRWCESLNGDDREVAEFCRALRLRLGFGNTSDLAESVDDRMSRYGLKSGDGPRKIVLGSIREIIKTGGSKKKVTRESLRKFISENDLWVQAVDNPKVSLTIHGWTKELFDPVPTVEIDWTGYIDRPTRRVPSQAEWECSLLPELQQAKKVFQNVPEGRYIDFRGNLPLTTVLAVGAEFPDVGGFSFRTQQPTGTETNLWRSDTPPTQARFRYEALVGSDQGEDIALFLSISGDGRADAENFLDENRGTTSGLIYAEPDSGSGQTAIRTAGDAVALADHAKQLIRESRTKYRAKRVHLVLFAPASFGLFLGQKLNAVGRIVTYERTADGGYQESVTIATG